MPGDVLTGLLAYPELVNQQRQDAVKQRAIAQAFAPDLPPQVLEAIGPQQYEPLGGTGVLGKILSGVGKVGAVLSAASGNPVNPAPRRGLDLGAVSNFANIQEQRNKRQLLGQAAAAFQAGNAKLGAQLLAQAGSAQGMALLAKGASPPSTSWQARVLKHGGDSAAALAELRAEKLADQGAVTGRQETLLNERTAAQEAKDAKKQADIDKTRNALLGNDPGTGAGAEPNSTVKTSAPKGTEAPAPPGVVKTPTGLIRRSVTVPGPGGVGSESYVDPAAEALAATEAAAKAEATTRAKQMAQVRPALEQVQHVLQSPGALNLLPSAPTGYNLANPVERAEFLAHTKALTMQNSWLNLPAEEQKGNPDVQVLKQLATLSTRLVKAGGDVGAITQPDKAPWDAFVQGIATGAVTREAAVAKLNELVQVLQIFEQTGQVTPVAPPDETSGVGATAPTAPQGGSELENLLQQYGH